MKRTLTALLALLLAFTLCGCSHASKNPKSTATPKPTASRKATATPKATPSPKTTPRTPAPTSLRDVSGDWPKEVKSLPVFDYGTYLTYGTQPNGGKTDRKLEYAGVAKEDVQAYVNKLDTAGLDVSVLTDSDKRYKVQGTKGSGADAPTVIVNLELGTGDCEVVLEYAAAGG